MSDTWPPPGPQKRPPTLEHVRDVWTLHGVQATCTVAIWRNDFGLALLRKPHRLRAGGGRDRLNHVLAFYTFNEQKEHAPHGGFGEPA